jgi:hypothetical protein
MSQVQLLHFAVITISEEVTASGVLVTCTTNYPVHLWLRWTNVEPKKHVNQRMVRGAPVGTYIDQCFTVFHDLEQNEPGDTLVHTFTAEPWPICQTRWFYLWGTVGGVLSPSCSPIFKYHAQGFLPPPFPWTMLLLEEWEGPFPQEGWTLKLWERWTH